MATKKVVDMNSKPEKKKSNRISVNSLEKVIKEKYKATTMVEWEGLEIEVKKNLSFSDMMSFVKDVVEACFTSNDTYLPEVKEFAVKASVIEYYTNVALPQSPQKSYDIINCTDLLNVITPNINAQQLTEMYVAIDKRLDYLSKTQIEAINKRMDELLERFEELESTLSNTFNGIEKDKMIGLIDAISNGAFDEKKLMNAYYEHKEAEEVVTEDAPAVEADGE